MRTKRETMIVDGYEYVRDDDGSGPYQRWGCRKTRKTLWKYRGKWGFDVGYHRTHVLWAPTPEAAVGRVLLRIGEQARKEAKGYARG